MKVPHWVQAKLRGQSLLDDAATGAGVDQGRNRDGSGNSFLC